MRKVQENVTEKQNELIFKSQTFWYDLKFNIKKESKKEVNREIISSLLSNKVQLFTFFTLENSKISNEFIYFLKRN